ncbi:hypothetical protein BCR42DRAFT_440134 [Absidia repens]|uniref:Uncharacterized protein n=1 Tax=Absidia repens TaxID=90262 RepID=A0A1X2I9S5_9FUNG|nr:hypothetical protein BCR42DRAFT_440134 [Absidia repens]
MAYVPPPPPALSPSTSSSMSVRSLSSSSSTKTLVSIRLFSSNNSKPQQQQRQQRQHRHWGFYKLFSSSAPVLYTPPPTPTDDNAMGLHRSQSYCDRLPSMKELTRQCTTTTTTPNKTSRKKTTTTKGMSIRAMELEALIDSYPHYTLHLTLTPRLCLDK